MADNDALCAIDDERAIVGHHGYVAHEDFLFLDLAGFFHNQAGLYVEGLGVGNLPLLTLLRRVLGVPEVMVKEMQLIFIAGVIGYG